MINRRPSVDYARLSTMPRANTEARGYLDRYQMAIEKARLEKEFETLEIRRVQIQTRLQQLSLSLGTPIAASDGSSSGGGNVQQSASASSSTSSNLPIQSSTSSDAYQTFVLEF